MVKQTVVRSMKYYLTSAQSSGGQHWHVTDHIRIPHLLPIQFLTHLRAETAQELRLQLANRSSINLSLLSSLPPFKHIF